MSLLLSGAALSGATAVPSSVRGPEPEAGLKEVSSGANVSLLVPYDEGVYYMASEVGSMRTVCPIQLYLDLKGYKGRGDEALEAVWQQEISKLW